MTKSFTEDEKCTIREQILIKSKAMFEQKGFQKTTVDAIVEAVGIAKGSFYSFYSSKEVLFFEILGSIEREMHISGMKFLAKRIKEQTFTEAFSSLILKQMKEIEEEPILFKAFDLNLMEKIWRKLPENMQIANIEFDTKKVDSIISLAKEVGYKCTVEAETLAGVLRSISIVLINKDIVGESYEDVSKILIKSSINKIFKK